MTIHPIGPTAALIFLTRAQLQQRGLHPEELTHEHAEELAQEGLSALNRSPDAALELESYPGEDGLLLFVRTAPPVWRFADGDALLDAVNALPDLDTGTLYRWKGAFWLVGDAGAALSEFADTVRDDPLLIARLAEYAQPLS